MSYNPGVDNNLRLKAKRGLAGCPVTTGPEALIQSALG